MIGVISRENQRAAVEEFFELFKTSWEYWQKNGTYAVVITTDPDALTPAAKLVIAFCPETTLFDFRNEVKILSRENGANVEWEGSEIPVYGEVATFSEPQKPFLSSDGGGTVGLVLEISGCKILRIGYDLFEEIEYLLGHGQPVAKAQIPTLELHIAALRKWILDNGISLFEIPPSPYGYDFMTCLTHDIDFMGIRGHRFDRTMFGFAYRSLMPRYLKGLERETFRARYRKNLRALASLPLVHMGLRPDFWRPLEQYPEVEKDLKSTFFLIPFRDRPGESIDGKAVRYRAARYDVGRHLEQIRSLTRQGCEVGLHGIDSWKDPRKGREELDAIRRITRMDKIGARMHWLFFSKETPKHLEEAGVYYDSTLGYNDTVGFRSGTSQVFRLPGASKVFELPLHVQDTAMLFPGRMNLSEFEAIVLCGKLLENIESYGGVFTLNWHDRSLAPERNWDAVYLALLGMLREKKTWFATAGEAVAWFEKRRASSFERPLDSQGIPRVNMRIRDGGNGPSLILRVHRPAMASHGTSRFRYSFVDRPVSTNAEGAAG